jgi:hypothetical protein
VSTPPANIGHKVLGIASSQKGKHEIPPGSNRGPDVQKYQHATFLAGTGWPWCAAFFCWVNQEAGYPMPYKTAGAYDFLDWARKTGNSPSTPREGDGVVYNIGSGHIGVFKSATGTHDNGTVTSVDGNWADAVTEHTLNRNLVRGYVRNPHAKGPAHVAASKKRTPMFKVTTSASGHKKLVYAVRKKKGIVKFIQNHGLGKFKNGITIKKGKA